MPGPCEKNHIQVVFFDLPHQVNIGKGQPRARSPVTQQAILDVFGLQGLTQQRVVLKVDHAKHQIIAGAPKSIGFS
jgi:hypothetical protein